MYWSLLRAWQAIKMHISLAGKRVYLSYTMMKGQKMVRKIGENSQAAPQTKKKHSPYRPEIASSYTNDPAAIWQSVSPVWCNTMAQSFRMIWMEYSLWPVNHPDISASASSCMRRRRIVHSSECVTQPSRSLIGSCCAIGRAGWWAGTVQRPKPGRKWWEKTSWM